MVFIGVQRQQIAESACPGHPDKVAVPTATFGHFGRRDEGFPWEDLGLARNLRQRFGDHA